MSYHIALACANYFGFSYESPILQIDLAKLITMSGVRRSKIRKLVCDEVMSYYCKLYDYNRRERALQEVENIIHTYSFDIEQESLDIDLEDKSFDD